MSDRTETLLAELIEVQRRQLANQERAIAHQEQALAVQQAAVERQRNALRATRVLVVVLVLLVGAPYVFMLMR